MGERESNHFAQKKTPPEVIALEACRSLGLAPVQVRYWIKNSEIPGKNSSSKVRRVSLIKKGMMPL